MANDQEPKAPHNQTLNPWSQKRVPPERMDPKPPKPVKPPKPDWAPHLPKERQP